MGAAVVATAGSPRPVDASPRLTAVNGERVRGHEQGTVLLKAATGTLLLEVRPEPKPPP